MTAIIISAIIDYIKNNPELLIIGTISFFVVKDILKRLTTTEANIKELAKETKNELNTVKTDLTGMKINIAKIITLLKSKGSPDNVLFDTASPLHVTDRGMEVLTESGLKEIIEKDKKHLFELIDTKNKQKIENQDDITKYDIQQTAMNVVTLLIDTHLMKKPKKYAFDNGSNFSDMLTAAGIYLRDIYLKEVF